MYAKLNRTAIRIALCIAAMGGVSLTHAGYSQLAAPPGFSVSGGGFGYAAAANDAVFGQVIHQPGGLTANVGGQAVKMPAAYRLAANAPRIAAGVIFAHPYVRAGAAIASWLGVAGLVWDAVNNRWTAPDSSVQYPVSDGRMWYAGSNYTTFQTKEQACENLYGGKSGVGYTIVSTTVEGNTCYANAQYDDTGYYPKRFSAPLKSSGDSSCPAGWYVTPAGCVQTPPPKTVTKEEFEDALAPKPMPDKVPLELPPNTPLPVEQPFINPEPGPNPAHRPQFVPTGNPVLNPKYDPNSPVGPANQPYLQPGVRIVPSPTPSNPWQVDMQPVDRPVGSADPNPQPQPDSEPGDGDKPKPEDQQSLCEKHPDILACSKPDLDTPEDEIPRETRDVSYQPESLFGGGVCPSNKTLSTHGMELMVWDWQEACGYITGYFRPVILVLCAFAAFVIVSGGARQS